MLNRISLKIATTLLTGLALILAPGLALAGHHLANEAEAAAEEVADNVENSEELMEETYDKDRAAGEGRVEAAGNAYEAVLEAGREKADE